MDFIVVDHTRLYCMYHTITVHELTMHVHLVTALLESFTHFQTTLYT